MTVVDVDDVVETRWITCSWGRETRRAPGNAEGSGGPVHQKRAEQVRDSSATGGRCVTSAPATGGGRRAGRT